MRGVYERTPGGASGEGRIGGGYSVRAGRCAGASIAFLAHLRRTPRVATLSPRRLLTVISAGPIGRPMLSLNGASGERRQTARAARPESASHNRHELAQHVTDIRRRALFFAALVLAGAWPLRAPAQDKGYPVDEASFMRAARAAYQAGDMRRYQEMLFEGIKRGYADAEADYAGLLLLAGSGAEGARNRELAFKLLTRASNRGHAGAMYALALCYRHGWGVAPDPAQYRHWLVRGAAAGSPEAQRACRDQGLCQ